MAIHDPPGEDRNADGGGPCADNDNTNANAAYVKIRRTPRRLRAPTAMAAWAGGSAWRRRVAGRVRLGRSVVSVWLVLVMNSDMCRHVHVVLCVVIGYCCGIVRVLQCFVI